MRLLMLGDRFRCASSSLPVFYEVMGHLQLSYIVVVCGDPGQYGMGAYALGRRLAEVSHEHAVVVGAGGRDHHLLEQRVLEVCKLKELEVGGVVEGMLDEGKETGRHQAAPYAPEEDEGDLQR